MIIGTRESQPVLHKLAPMLIPGAGQRAIISEFDRETDSRGRKSVSVTTMWADTKEVQEKLTLTRDMLLVDLSEFHKQNVAFNSKFLTKGDLSNAPVGILDRQGWYIGLVQSCLESPGSRPSPNTICAILSEEQWQQESASFRASGGVIYQMDKEKRHRVFASVSKKGNVVHFSNMYVEGSYEMDLTYHIVRDPGCGRMTVASLLPRLLTGDIVQDPDVRFVYAHVKPKHPECLGSLHTRLCEAISRMVDIPLVFENKLSHCSDAGRKAVAKALVAEANLNETYTVWEILSAYGVNTMQSLFKDFPDARDLASTEQGRNRIQDALQFVHHSHPAHNPYYFPFTDKSTAFYMKMMPMFACILSMELAQEYKEWKQQRADQQRARHRAACERNTELENAASKEAERRRKAQAADSRARRAMAVEKAFTAYCTPPASSKSAKKQARAERRLNLESQLTHGVHVNPDQKQFRSAAFDQRQANVQREAREAREREHAAALQLLAKSVEAHKAAAEHHVPPKATVAEFVQAAESA